MAFIVKTAKTIRNNWKKSVFFAGTLGYGVNYGYEKYLINELMREYCMEAVQYGDVTVKVTDPIKKVLIILNPTANKKKSLKKYEAYCEPILNLAGISIEMVKTDSEGHARRYVEEMEKLPDVLLVAGGDGTLSEAVTGLLRRTDYNRCPVGILPVGRTNSVGRALFSSPEETSTAVGEAKSLANAAISVVRGKTEKCDVMKIEVLPDAGDTPGKPIFAMGNILWGAYRDAFVLRDKYWYTGPLREYVTFVANSFGEKITWECNAQMKYSPPCTGCSNCFGKEMMTPVQVQTSTRWWSKFVPRTRSNPADSERDYSKVVNAECANITEVEIGPTDFQIVTNNLKRPKTESKIDIRMGPNQISSFEFISSSWSQLNGKELEPHQTITARTVEILPRRVHTEEDEIFYSIDNEDYEVKPIRISLIPRAINMFAL